MPRQRRVLEVGLQAVGDLVQQSRALGDRSLGPSLRRLPSRLDRPTDILRVAARDLATRLAVHRRNVRKILAVNGIDPLASR